MALPTHYREIPKEQYDHYKSIPYGEASREIESNLSDSIRWGYGYYGFDLKEENGKYYLGITTGNSCD